MLKIKYIKQKKEEKQFKNEIKKPFSESIKGFMIFFSNKRWIVDQFTKNKKHIAPGKYRFDKTLNYIYLDNDLVMDMATDMLDNGYLMLAHKTGSFLKEKTKNFIINILSSKLRVVENDLLEDSNLQGVILLPSGNRKSIKIFDINKGVVFSSFTDKDAYEKKVSTYNYFNNHFPMPLIINQDDNLMHILEECIDYKVYDEWLDDDFLILMNDVLTRIYDYFNFKQRDGNYFRRSPKEIYKGINRDDILIHEIYAGINESIKNIRFPFVKLSGDMWTSNILIDKLDGTVRYIDFEHAKDYFILYDILFLIWNEAEYHQSFRYLDHYLRGDYDSDLNKIFELFNLEFEKEYRFDYLNIFFLNQYEDRWTKSGNAGILSIYKRYKTYMNYAEEHMSSIFRR